LAKRGSMHQVLGRPHTTHNTSSGFGAMT
jgi:hypothetical protein